MKVKKSIVAAAIVVGFSGGMVSAAFAGDPGTGKCNAGRGNGSETDPANDCDPGNSGAHNNGGD
jgi:hypothetical protein